MGFLLLRMLPKRWVQIQGRRVGSLGKFGILSFNGNKIITTSGGGALVSEDEAMIKRARFLSTQARDPAPHYQHSAIGYNYRMSNMVAGYRSRTAGGARTARRAAQGNQPGIGGAEEMSRASPSKPNLQRTSSQTTGLHALSLIPEKAGTDREKLRLALEAENIEARPLWKPMHLQPVFAGCPAYVNGTSEALFNNGLCLPSGTRMTEEEMERIEEVLRREFGFSLGNGDGYQRNLIYVDKGITYDTKY